MPKCYPFYIFIKQRNGLDISDMGMAWIKVKYVILEKTEKGRFMPWINVIVIWSSYKGQDVQ